MGYLFEFDAKKKVLRSTFEGQITGDVLFEFYSTARKLFESLPPFSAIVDFSGVTRFDVSSNIIEKLAKMPPFFGVDSILAIVAPNDLIYGLTRMYSILSEQSRPNAHVVRTMREAYALLRVVTPRFERIRVE